MKAEDDRVCVCVCVCVNGGVAKRPQFLDNGSNNSVVIGTHTALLVLKSITTTITQLVLARHNIRLTYSKYLRLVIVFIASDIALAP